MGDKPRYKLHASIIAADYSLSSIVYRIECT